jgi:hypothetical protein
MLHPTSASRGNDSCRRAATMRFALAVGGMLAFFALIGAQDAAPNQSKAPAHETMSVDTIVVDATPGHEVNAFRPDQALGSSMDALPEGVVDKIYTPTILQDSLSAGWGPISYRNNTELRIAAWHWNPKGTWSDAAHQSGYFTGGAGPTEMLRHSYFYDLPHRGDTRNGGTEYGYSRLTDGDPHTYWKSNPYLTRRFTDDDDALHPQWVVIDLGSTEKVSELRIAWANPYARRYDVQYWDGKDPMNFPTQGVWTLFPRGEITNGEGGSVTLKLADAPLPVRYIRIWMTKSSDTCDTHGSGDVRNCVGYAIDEVYAGNISDDGRFVDLLRHSPDQGQSATYCSSTDPWHSATDLDAHRGDQTGFDLFFTSGITNHLPAMIPVAVLYGIPEDAAAEIAYLEKRGYAIGYVEMGEEPDGQNVLPEDYAELYLQAAVAIHRVDANVKLGGPVFEGSNDDIQVWPDAQGRTSWLGRFLDYLKAHGRMNDLAFMSFEHYPLASCDVTWSDLYREPQLVSHILGVWRTDGLPANVPMFITESGLAAEQTQAMTEIFSALWLAENAGAFFSAGGSAFYHSPIQPEPIRAGCHGWGTYGNFVADANFQIKGHTAQYYASWMINKEWVQHGAGVHEMFAAASDLTDGAGNALVVAYPVRRPDGEWSLLLVNRDESNAHSVRVNFAVSGAARPLSFQGAVRMVTFGGEQYVWHSDGANSNAEPDNPPVESSVPGGADAVYMLLKASITVLRGRVSGLNEP